jgi:hypothetical protein
VDALTLFSNLSDADKLKDCFGSQEPRIATYPHLLLPRVGWSQPAWAIDTLLNVVLRTAGGVWGEDLAERDSESAAEMDGRLVRHFVDWEKPANQWKLFVHVAEGRSTDRFTAVLDTKVSLAVLERMARCEVNRDNMPVYINRMADWIDELGWAYFPLAYECPYAMLASNRERAAAVEEMEAILRNCHLGYARLVCHSGNWKVASFSHPYKAGDPSPT